MSSRPRLADLCCKAGGAARGYAAAGFEVTGFDIVDQPRYPDHLIIRDVLQMDPILMGQTFDAFHASPSCKGYTALRTAHNARPHARQIPQFIKWLNATGKPWVLENVEEAREDMPGAITLCGTMFNLGTQGCQLQRHRLFMANFPLITPEPHVHLSKAPVIGVYGGHARIRAASHGGRTTRDSWVGGHRTAAAEALGIPVGEMTLDELSEAIPPAYAKWVGTQLIREVLR